MRGQNLSHGAAVPLAKPQMFTCRWCTKKYKKQQKLDAHVDKCHPFAAINKNTYEFTMDEKLWLLDELEAYIRVLKEYNRDTFEHATRNLGDLERMLPIHQTFRDRIIPHLDKVVSSGPQVLRVIDEFRAYLNLGFTPRGDNWCPSLLIDLVWHSAMQNKERYLPFVNRFLYGQLPHCLPENDGDGERFEAFVRQFRHQHGRSYMTVDDLVAGNETNGIREARDMLRREDEEAKRRAAEERVRWQTVLEQRDRLYQEGTNVYKDDGKC